MGLTFVSDVCGTFGSFGSLLFLLLTKVSVSEEKIVLLGKDSDLSLQIL